MFSRSFLQLGSDQVTTLSEIRRIYESFGSSEFFGLFAYATQSGLRSFEFEFGEGFWGDTANRWLFGIDYGRTQPAALREMLRKANSDIRIFDGDWLVKQDRFIPRHDFHAKFSMLKSQPEDKVGVIIGSGNFSSNGLRRSVEAGTTIQLKGSDPDYQVQLGDLIERAEKLWLEATPLTSIIDEYEDRWSDSLIVTGGDVVEPDEIDVVNGDYVWIEAGYVTKNRGEFTPGNQIDLPRGMCRYFGFVLQEGREPNSTIGAINFVTPDGITHQKNLRLGNNMMEKITLPMPERCGLDLYDGKILTFQRDDNHYFVNALESDDFERVFGDQLGQVFSMGSGRRYGLISSRAR